MATRKLTKATVRQTAIAIVIAASLGGAALTTPSAIQVSQLN